MAKGSPGKPSPRKKVNNAKVQRELKGKECSHAKKVTQTNRKGQEYEECESCGAFLGYK